MYASGQTPNLHLPQWQTSDFVRMEDFNAAMMSIDSYVDTVNDQLDSLDQSLTASMQRTNYNVFQLISRDWFQGNWTGAEPDAMYLNIPNSAAEAGTCTGFTWSTYPIKLGRYSVSLSNTSQDIHDASVQKTVVLDGPFTQATLLVIAHGWYSKTPPLSSMDAHVEDYTGFTVGASINGIAMTADGYASTAFPYTCDDYSNPACRQWQLKLDGTFDGSTTVQIDFHCPTDRALWVYGWGLILA